MHASHGRNAKACVRALVGRGPCASACPSIWVLSDSAISTCCARRVRASRACHIFQGAGGARRAPTMLWREEGRRCGAGHARHSPDRPLPSLGRAERVDTCEVTDPTGRGRQNAAVSLVTGGWAAEVPFGSFALCQLCLLGHPLGGC